MIPVVRVYLALEDSEHQADCPEKAEGGLCYQAPVARYGERPHLMWVHELFVVPPRPDAPHLVIPR